MTINRDSIKIIQLKDNALFIETYDYINGRINVLGYADDKIRDLVYPEVGLPTNPIYLDMLLEYNNVEPNFEINIYDMNNYLNSVDKMFKKLESKNYSNNAFCKKVFKTIKSEIIDYENNNMTFVISSNDKIIKDETLPIKKTVSFYKNYVAYLNNLDMEELLDMNGLLHSKYTK